MNIKTIEDVAKLQKDLGEELQRYIEALRERKPPSLQMLRKDQARLIERAQAGLERAVKERDEVVRLADQQVQRRRDELARLQQALEELDRNGEGAQEQKPSVGSGDKPTRTKRR